MCSLFTKFIRFDFLTLFDSIPGAALTECLSYGFLHMLQYCFKRSDAVYEWTRDVSRVRFITEPLSKVTPNVIGSLSRQVHRLWLPLAAKLSGLLSNISSMVTLSTPKICSGSGMIWNSFGILPSNSSLNFTSVCARILALAISTLICFLRCVSLSAALSSPWAI